MSVSKPDLDACRGGIVAIGNFDGVHRGHQRMAEVLTSRAKAVGVPSVAMTFYPPPVALLRPDRVPPSLTTIARRTELLRIYGVDEVLIWPTSRDLLNLSPRDFFDQVIVGQLDAAGLVEGPNFFFGRDRAGTVETLAEYCDQASLTFEVVRPVKDSDDLVSSSRIRQLVADGDLSSAVDLLGHSYRVSGEVVHGAARGRTLGFPTANLADIATLLPAEGVYAGFCEVAQREYAAAVNIGRNPTFAESGFKVEVHLLDYDGELYGSQLHVDLLSRVRPVQSFDGPEQLQLQIKKDIEAVREIFSRRKISQ